MCHRARVEAAGYIIAAASRDKNGQMRGMEYTVLGSRSPEQGPEEAAPKCAQPRQAEPEQGKTCTGKSLHN